ncbi:MAG: thiamine pyrophosphate-dependent enzyme [Mycobacterium sp.]
MPAQRRLTPAQPWIELRSTAADWKKADSALLATMLSELHLIRAFEETVLKLASDGLVHGPAHSSIGQEGGAVGSIVGLLPDDAINGSHRSHHQFLAKAISHVAKGTLDPTAMVTEAVEQVLQRTLAEILGLAQGFCKGRGGSIHLQWLEAGALGSNAIVGGGVPLAAGNAWSQRAAGTRDVTISYFGDGAVNIGSTLETMNLAAAWDIPLNFFIENNLYAVATTVDESTREHRLSGRGLGFGIPAWRVDGMDPLAVHLATEAATEVMRSGGGPTIIEAQVYRFFHQNGAYEGSAFGYRTKEEESDWRARDPITRLEDEMRRLGHLTDAQFAEVREQAVAAMRDVVAALVEPDPEVDGRNRIIPSLWPDPETVNHGLRGDASELDALVTTESPNLDQPTTEKRFVDAISDVIGRRMQTDPSIVVLGEDVHRLGGGTNGATKRALREAPERVLGTPISENAFAGLAGGMALDGRFRPIVEFMYPDFLWVAADQVFNQIGKARHMFGGDSSVPLVLRTKVALGTGYGSQHLMDPAGIFATSPGWRIIAPSTAADYIGLMNTALALQDPVLVIEHTDLYGKREPVPDGDPDYYLPLGRAAVRRTGSDVTVLSYLNMVAECEQAIERTGVDGELIDLRWLDRASIDWETIEASVRKTNNVLIVEQGAHGTSYGAWLSDEINRRLFDWLDSPVTRVTGSEASPVISRVLERASIALSSEVADALEQMRRNWGGES